MSLLLDDPTKISPPQPTIGYELRYFLTAIAISAFIVFCPIPCGLQFLRFYALSVISLPFHECGHFFFFWLPSKVALPIVGEPLTLNSFLSVIASCTAIAIYSYLTIASALKKRWFLSMRNLVVLMLIITVSFFLSMHSFKVLAALSGMWGDFVFSSIAICCFFTRDLKSGWRRVDSKWRTFKYSLLWYGSLCFFFHIFLLYWAAVGKTFAWDLALIEWTELPLGANCFGDVCALMSYTGWTADPISYLYLWEAVVCLSVICAVYFWHALNYYYSRETSVEVEQA